MNLFLLDLAKIIAISGVTRKQLGLEFVGESKPTVRALFGDIYIKGLDVNVSSTILTFLFMSHPSSGVRLLIQYWHRWGDAGTILYVVLHEHSRPSETQIYPLFVALTFDRRSTKMFGLLSLEVRLTVNFSLPIKKL